MLDKEYQKTISWLFNQFPSYQNIGTSAYKPDLTNIKILCNSLGNPEKKLKFIHVAGTNGKGSTSSMLASILTESGYKTGLFTSPHIEDFRERIRINGQTISKEAVIAFCKKTQELNLTFEPSFFEITFAMALFYFNNEGCEICVIETGLGGRLDATNIIQPILSLITNISLEHTQLLGDTLEKIAFEKAGIMKSNSTCIIGQTTPQTRAVFEYTSKKKDTTLLFSEDFKSTKKYTLPILGEYQIKNFHLVECALEFLRSEKFNIEDTAIQNGLLQIQKNTGFRARMELYETGPLVIIDVSHNEAGLKETFNTIQKINKGKLHLIFGASKDKDFSQLGTLIPQDSDIYLCQFSNSRSLNTDELNDLSKNNFIKPKIFQSIREAYPYVKGIVNKDDSILITGSFFLASDFFKFFPKKKL